MGPLSVPRDADGIVVVAVRRFERPGAAAMLGAHVMSPPHVSAMPLEERLVKVLHAQDLDVLPAHRVPATLPLPAGLAGTSMPIVVLTLNVTVGLDRLAQLGSALRQVREEGVVLVGIAHDGPVASGGEEMVATVSLLLGAACDDDRVAEIGTRGGGLGFVLVPELHESLPDEACCFWSVEAAGEMPYEVVEQLRPFLLPDDAGDNQDMKKKGSAIQITRFDKTRLMELLRSLDAAPGSREEIAELEQELERGAEVESTDVAPDVVTMNSTVRVTDLDASTTHVYTIVFPGDADFEKGRISILSPLGTALLGYRAGDVVTWEMPRGTRRLRIEELVYQPEAAGDFHL
jgi:regulator of nucleoside diphosphate kinase